MIPRTFNLPPGCLPEDIDPPEDNERTDEDEKADRQRDDDIDRQMGL